VKSGISAPQLRPTLAVVDPLLTRTQPAEVTASAGMDILCHALESYTARPYNAGPRKRADQRVPYCGANPVADMWSERALTLLAESFRPAVRNGKDVDARRSMAMAATFAGLGFGNAGVHIPHANAYPLAGQVRDFRPAGYPQDHAMIPHGMSVALTAAESFRFTFDAAPQRHLRAARLLEPHADLPDDATALPDVICRLMRDLGLPNGIAAVGFTEDDIPDLVQGSLKQQRLLAIAPRPVEAQDLERIFAASLTLW
jgi:alcohol dehydrogenase class IV